MNNGWKYVVMHVSIIAAVCYMSHNHSDATLIIGLITGWFGFLTGDKINKSSGSPVAQTAPVALPMPKDAQ